MIPTAKAFYQNYIEENNHDSHVDIEEMLIEFAKLHVEAALKEASEKATVYADEGGYSEFVDEQSILNSYSLDNIK
jgi:hypothetical protein